MIKFENGLVKISGKGIDVLSEYAVITHEIKEMFVKDGGKEEEVKEQLRHSFEHGLMNEEELEKKSRKSSNRQMQLFRLCRFWEKCLKHLEQKIRRTRHGRN